jgi:hypothetical protein
MGHLQSLEGHRDRVAHAQRIQRTDSLVTEEGAVHAHFEDHCRQDLRDFTDAIMQLRMKRRAPLV